MLCVTGEEGEVDPPPIDNADAAAEANKDEELRHLMGIL